MAKTKYGDYVKSLTFKDYGPGLYRQGTEMNGAFLGYDVHMQYGTYWSAGRTGKEPSEAEVNDFDQVMLWMGADMNDPGELGAEVELWLGEEGEKHMIASSTAVLIPNGLPHLPVNVTRMDKRFIHMTISLAPELKSKTVKVKNLASELAGWRDAKHMSKIMHVAFVRKGAWHYGPQNRDDAGGSIADINGRDFTFNMSYESIRKAPYRFGPIPDKPHVHNYTEFLLFMGADTNDLSELGAEAEMSMGKEMERHIITTPTIVVQPKGFPHCPLAINKVYKPFIFAVIRPFGH